MDKGLTFFLMKLIRIKFGCEKAHSIMIYNFVAVIEVGEVGEFVNE